MLYADLYAIKHSSVDLTPAGRLATSRASVKTPFSTVSRSAAKQRRRVVIPASSHVTHHQSAKRIGLVHSRSSLLATVSGRRKKSSVTRAPGCLIHPLDRLHSNATMSVLDSSETAT